jgi:S-adenosylmethionine/arginine decarboxylase-like enzyme
MPVYSSDFSELLEPTLRVVYDQEEKAWETEFDKFMTIESSSKAVETDFSTTGFGVAQDYADGAGVPFDTVYRGWKKQYTHVQAGLGFIITRIMYEDDQYRHMKAKPRALARSLNEYVEILCANILNRATSGSYLGADGVALASSVHPTIAGGTWSNTQSADLDVTSFEQSLIGIGNFINERGLKYKAKPQQLIVSTSDTFQAEIILKSAQLPGGANNDFNPAKGILPKGTLVLHYLTDTDAWGVTTDAPNGLLFFWRRQKEFTNDTDWNSDNAKYKGTMRCSAGWTDPRCIHWSPGG